MKQTARRALVPLRRLARRGLGIADPGAAYDPVVETIVFKAANILAAEKVEGDYLEFGVYAGASLIQAYRTIETVFAQHQALNDGRSPEDAQAIRRIWESMRFFAFDSFEGLPALEGVDTLGRDFAEGKYACSEAGLRARLDSAGIPPERLVTVPGWFEQTCRPETIDKLRLRKASIIHVDCDLYTSARVVLDFVTPLLTDGTILIFDDWYCFRGHPDLGEQRAFEEWRAGLDGWRFTQYQKEGPWRNSFIANRDLGVASGESEDRPAGAGAG